MYIVAIVIAIISAVVCFITLDKELSDKTRLLRATVPDEVDNREINRTTRLIICICILLVTLAATLYMASQEIDWLGFIKMSIGTICLSGAACNDFREHRIPNVFPLIMAVSAIILLGIGFFTSQNGSTAYIFSSIFAAVVVAIFMVLASLLTKRGIGMGDIKLLTALALLGGVHTIGWTLTFGVGICAIVAVILLVTKKKTIKGAMPFGPFVFIGYILTIFLNKY